MDDLNQTDQEANNAEQGIDGQASDTAKSDDVQAKSDAGKNAEQGSSHTLSVGTIVTPVDGQSSSSGQQNHGQVLGVEKIWNDEKQAFVDTENLVIGWFQQITVHDPKDVVQAK